MRRHGLLVAAAIILATNAVVLIEVARNRAGAPVETIQLTERELPLNFLGKEDTGVALRLNWRRFSPVTDDYAWLDRTKLEGLGFDYVRAMRDPQHPPLPRPAFVVFEYNGPAWEKWLRSAPQPVHQPEMFPRLTPIDAATTPEPLLGKYPDRGEYLIVEGIIQISAVTRQGQLQLLPSISQIVPDTIHVPPPLSDPFNLMVGTNPDRPRYTLTLSYGRGFEPWLERVDTSAKN